MKKFLTLLSFLPFLGLAQICNPGGNVVIFSNYDGGILNINVDANIPNLKIGVLSYEAVTVNLSGAFVNNVTAVEYAGYNGSSGSCGPSSTTINGEPVTATTNILFLPPATLTNPNGYTSMVCAYSCDNGSSQGGCNTVDQVEDYFVDLFVGTLYSHTVQYGCWSGTKNVSTSGNCCPPAPFTSSFTQTNTSCNAECDGSITVSASGGTSPYTYSWSPGGMTTATVSGLCANTYTVTVADNAGGSDVHVVTITQPAAITSTQNLDICEGEDHTYPDGTTATNVIADESHISTLTAVNGCDSVVTTNLNVIAAPNDNVTATGFTLNADQTGATYQWIDCNNGNAAISGATNQSYTPTVDGSYAVEVTLNGCTITSSCQLISGIGFIENTFGSALSVYPNPTVGNLSINLGTSYSNVEIVITDALGKEVSRQQITDTQLIEFVFDQPAGNYLVTIQSEEQKAVFRLIKL